MQLLPETLEHMYQKGYSLNGKGEEKRIDDAISRDEAISIARALRDDKAVVTVEIGVASGTSALTICHNLREMGNKEAKHYGVDPNQMTDYGGIAIENLKKANLDDIFHLMEGPSHMKVPELISNKVIVDFALIDGWHTFDYTLVDFFLVDKILRPGGIVAFHDTNGLAKQKVLKYIKTHRHYEVVEDYLVRGNESFSKTIKFFLWRIFQKPSLLFSSYHWRYQLKNSSGLFFLRKKENYEPPYHFYKPF